MQFLKSDQTIPDRLQCQCSWVMPHALMGYRRYDLQDHYITKILASFNKVSVIDYNTSSIPCSRVFTVIITILHAVYVLVGYMLIPCNYLFT